MIPIKPSPDGKPLPLVRDAAAPAAPAWLSGVAQAANAYLQPGILNLQACRRCRCTCISPGA